MAFSKASTSILNRTMKGMLQVIPTPKHIQHVILGNASQNAIAGGHESGERLEELQVHLRLAYECEDWGNC